MSQIDPGAMGAAGIAGATERDVQVMLQADTQEYQQQMETAASATGGVITALAKVEQAFKAVLGTASKAAVGIGATMTAMAGTAATTAARFEDSFARVEKTTGLAGASLEQLNADIRQLSTETPIAARELAQLADISGQLGVSEENLAKYAETAATLGRATEISSQQAVTALSQVIGIFGEAEEDVDALASSFARLSVDTRATERDILNFTTRVGGAAQAAGVTADEVMGIGAAITGMGLQVEAAGTTVQDMLLRMQSAAQQGGDELAQFADVMGITRDEFKRMQQQDPARLFHDFVQALGLAEEQAGQLLQQLDINDVRATRTLLSLASASDELTEAMGMSKQAFNEANDVYELAEVRFDTLVQSLKQFRQSVAEIWRSIGRGLLPILQFVVDRLNDLLQVFHAIPEPVKKSMGILMGLTGVVATLAGTFGMVVASWHGLIALFAWGPKVVSVLTGAISTLTGAITAKAGAVSAATTATTAWGTAMQGTVLPALVSMLHRTKALAAGLVSWFIPAMRSSAAATAGFGAAAAGKGMMFLVTEFMHGLRNLGRAVLPLVTKAAWAAIVPLAKLALIAGSIYVAFKGVQWVFDELSADSERASDSLSTLAQSMGEAHTAAGGFSGEMNEAAESSVAFTDANRELVESLRNLGDEAAEVMAMQIATNLVSGGMDVETATETAEKLLQEAGVTSDLDIEGELTYDTNVEEFTAETDRMRDAIQGLVDAAESEDLALGIGNVSDETLEQFSQITEGIKHLAEEDPARALAQALDLRQAIEDADLTEGAQQRLEKEYRAALGEAFDTIENDAEGWWEGVKRAFGAEQAPSGTDLVKMLIGEDEEGTYRAFDEVEDRLQDLGTEIDDIGPGDMDLVVGVLNDIGQEAAETADAAAEAGENISELQRIWNEAGEPSDDQRRRRFREFHLQQQAEEKGHRRVIDLLQEKLEHTEEFGDEWKWVRQQIDEFGQQMAETEIRDLEEELKGKEAAEAVELLNERIRELNNQPGMASAVERAVEFREQQISSMERDLRRLLDERDRIMQRIEDEQERHQERMADVTERHHERLEEEQERHDERLADLEERKTERLADAREKRDERLEEIGRREEEAMADLAEDVASAYDPMQRLQSRPTASARGILANMIRETEVMAEFERNLRGLRERGLDQKVIEAMGLDDPRNFAQVERMLEDVVANPSLIEEINSAWDHRLDIGEGVADESGQKIADEHDELRQDAKEQFAETRRSIEEDFAEQQKELQKSFTETTKEIEADFAEQQKEMRSSHSETVGDLRDDLHDLSRDTGDSLEELIERGMNSNIEGIQSLASALETAVSSAKESIETDFADLNESIKDGWHAALQIGDGEMPDPRTLGGGHPASGAGGVERSGYTGGDSAGVIRQTARSIDRTLAEQFAKLGGLLGMSDDPADYRTPGLQLGGISTRAQLARLSEGGKPEAVIPLDERGTRFMARAMGEAMGGREQAMEPSTQQQSVFHVDRVVAHDPNKMARELRARERQKRLVGLSRRGQ